MNPRTEYEMTLEQYDKLIAACKSVPCMMIGGRAPSTPQENANAAWASLGKEMGFDSMTVKPMDKGKCWFTAVPCETDAQKEDRLNREASDRLTEKRKLLQGKISVLQKELDELPGGIAALSEGKDVE